MVSKILKRKAKLMNKNEKMCSLMLDEMSIKKGLKYDPSTDTVEGYEDFGTKGSSKIASHALVFMLRGITSNWKQPISYYLSDVSTVLDPLVIHCNQALTR